MTPEDVIQQKCVIWFRNNYCLKHHNPRLVIYSVPNSGKDKKEQMYKKATGMMGGVSDLVILLPLGKSVYIEMKTDKGTQKEKQKEFQETIENLGFIYILCRSFETFQKEIENILKK